MYQPLKKHAHPVKEHQLKWKGLQIVVLKVLDSILRNTKMSVLLKLSITLIILKKTCTSRNVSHHFLIDLQYFIRVCVCARARKAIICLQVKNRTAVITNRYHIIIFSLFPHQAVIVHVMRSNHLRIPSHVFIFFMYFKLYICYGMIDTAQRAGH